MNALKKEMERKRKAMALAKKNFSAGVDGDQKNSVKPVRFVKASEVRRIDDELRHKNHNSNKKTSGTKRLHSTLSNDEEGSSKEMSNDELEAKNPGSASAVAAEQSDVASRDLNSTRKLEFEGISKLSNAEVTVQLRKLGLPVKLFGEAQDPHRRKRRLFDAQKASRQTKADRMEGDEFKLKSNTGHNIRNPFLQRQDSDKEYSKVESKSYASSKKGSRVGIDNDASTGNRDEKEDSANSEKNRTDGKADQKEDDNHKRVHAFFKNLLKNWESDLVARPLSKKQTLAGKNELKTFKQCKDYIRPLFKLLKNRQLEERILAFLVEIVTYCEEGEFVKAHDSYMDLAIGRAAWPIGVTMVGIHARSGREKIGSNNVAHVMNSELQRKYLTSVKRLMTYAQTLRTDVEPSKKVR